MTPEAAEEADGRRLAGGGQAGARPPRVPPDHGGQPDEARGQVSQWSANLDLGQGRELY